MFKKVITTCFLIFVIKAVNAADVQISSLVDNIDPAPRGGEITYSISVLNGSNDTATNVVLVFPIPATTTFVSVNNGLCVHDGGAPGQVDCTLGNMVGDGVGGLITTIDFSIETSGATGNTVVVSATISADIDTDGSNNSENQNTTIDDGADLSLVVTDNPDPAVAGGTINYTITVSNNGPDDAGAAFNSDGVVVINTLPNGVIYKSFTGVGWNCNVAGQTVTCKRELIANGASAPNLMIVGDITGKIAGTITNSTTVSSITSDFDTSNNTVTENTLIIEGADLLITKTVESPVIGGTTTSFTLKPRNLGPYDATTVVVTDTLPTGFTYNSAIGLGWACSAVGLDVTCTRASYNVGATDDITIQTNVPASGTNITNTGIVSSATSDPDNGNDSGSVIFDIVPDGANLSITKVKTPDPVAQGSNMTSTINVSNLGPQNTSGILTVVDVLAAGETFVSGTDVNWSCNLVGGNPGGTLTCEYQGGSLIALTNTPVLSIITTATNAGALQNTVSVSDVGGQVDAVAGNNTALASAVSTANFADLSIVKTVSDNNLDIAENSTTYTLTVTNNGPNDIIDPGAGSIGVEIQDVIPGYVTAVTGAVPDTTGISVLANINSNGGASFSCAGSSTVVCTLDDGETFANGDFVDIDIAVTRPLLDGILINTATVTSEVLGDDDASNNSANVNLTVAALADVEMLAPSIPVNPAKAGTEATIVLQFRNNGPSTADGVQVVHVFNPPVGRAYTLISATPTEGSCAVLVGNTLTCSGMSLSRNENRQITLVVRPEWDIANNNWTLAGSTTITTTTDQQDNGVNVQSADLDVTQAELDLLVENNDVTDPIAWAAGPGAFPATLDNVIVYKVDVTNRGPSLATGVVLTYAMTPKAGKDISFLCDSTNASSCVADATSMCDNLGSTVTGGATLTLTCNLPENSGNLLLNAQELSPNTSTFRYLFFRAESAPHLTGDTHNTLASIASNEDDNLAGNNNEGESTSIRTKVDLAITKTAPSPTVGKNQPFNFIIRVSNNGPGDSGGSALSDNLPAGMTLTGTPIPSQGSCTGVNGDNAFTCDLQVINNNATVTITVPVTVATLGAITNTATVSTFGVDIDLSNNSDDATITIIEFKPSISGTVFNDLNDDGNQGVNDTGISGVQISLTGSTSLGASVSLTTTTDANGNYVFDNLFASNATGYTLTETQPTGFSDGLESVTNTVIVESRSTDVIKTIVLGNNDTFTDYNFAELGLASISGFVWVDTNNNGVRDVDEKGVISNAQINLLGTEAISGVAINLTMTTKEDGSYSFSALRAGTYSITEVQPLTWNDGKESLGSNGGNIGDDQFINIVLFSTTRANDYNFGERGSSSVSGQVFNDLNDDGSVSDDETGIANVLIKLTGVDINDIVVNMAVLTDEDGFYHFDYLMPSNDIGYLLTQEHPVDYMDGLDSINGVLIDNSRQSDEIQLSQLELEQEQINNLFAEVAGVNISGFVWVDTNNNGYLDADEDVRISGVTIHIKGVDTFGSLIEQTIVTDENGYYKFSRIPRGIYTLTEIQPLSWLDGKESLGSLGGTLHNDEFENISVVNIENGINYNFGEQGSSLQGRVFSDLNDNGTQEPNEAGISDVKIHLTGTNLDGQYVSIIVYTVLNGEYKFSNLPLPNSSGFSVVETQPEDLDDGKDSIGSHGGALLNDHFSNIIFTGHITNAIEYNFAELIQNPATISGIVWLDSNHNRNEDENNGQSGWIVELVEHYEDPFAPDNIIATVISGPDGRYIFDGLSPGLYEVRFRHPQGGILYGTPVSNYVGADTTNGTIRNLQLHKGEHIEEQNLPIDPSGIVYDSQTREPVAGAVVTIVGPSGFDPKIHLLGGESNVEQTTSNDGLYQFLLFNTAPSGTYRLEVESAVGYIPGVAPSIPACTNSLIVDQVPAPALVQLSDQPPVISSLVHSPNSCPTNIGQLESSYQSTQFYLSFEIYPLLPSSNVVNNHIPLDPYTNDLILVTKTSSEKNVSRGDFVPYQITVTNNNNFDLNNLTIVDQLPPGFKYVQDSAKLSNSLIEPITDGRTLRWNNINIVSGETIVIDLITIVGAGVNNGEYINQAWLYELNTNIVVSNTGNATIRVIPDPIMDCSDLIGKVFDDANINGYQDEQESGLPGVRLATAKGLLITTDENGRYHIACAVIPNEMRGSNFIIKVDERTLPSGYRITTENPRVTRLTRGKLAKINFGATIHKVIRVEVNNSAFVDKELTKEFKEKLINIISIAKSRPSVVRIAYQQQNESDDLIEQRMSSMKVLLENAWENCDCNYPLTIEEEIFRRNKKTDGFLPTRRTN